MANSCPNPHDPAWIKFVKEIGGEADALTVFNHNNGVIPSLEDAKSILNTIMPSEKDEQISRSPDNVKLERTKEQRLVLEKMFIATKNVAQMETLKNLINMNDDYQRFLRENLRLISIGQKPNKTVSVSNFIGSSDFKGDPLEYIAFQRFGTFMHEVIELSQTEALKSGKTIGDIFTKEHFDKLYQSYIERFPFQIENYTTEEMFNQALVIVNAINSHNSSGYILLPEITVVGQSSSGSKVIGRVDLMLINPEGNIEIYDFKTKKTPHLVSKNPRTGEVTSNLDFALVHLAEQEYEINGRKPGIAQSFREVDAGMRTAFDTWTIQLDLYDQILRQNGMNVTEKKIATLLYQTDENKKFEGAAIHVFTNQNYYLQATNTGIKGDYWFLTPSRVTARLDALKKAIKKEIPIPGEIVEETVQTPKSVEELLEFKISTEASEKFVKALEVLIDGQVSAINEKLTELEQSSKPNPTLKEILKTRKDSLISFSRIVKSNTKNASTILQSSNFFSAVDHVDFDLKSLAEVSDTSFKNFDFKNKTFPTNEQLQEHILLFQKSEAMSSIIAAMQELVNEAAQNPENKITSDSPVRKKLGQMITNCERITSNFRTISRATGVQIIQSGIGIEAHKAVSKEAAETLGVKLQYLEAKLEQLKSGEGLSVLKTLKSSLLSMVSKDYKDKLAATMDPTHANMLVEIENLEKQILHTQDQLNGFNYDYDSIDKYITSINDPDSKIYIGSQQWNNNSFLKGFYTDSVIASASNSDKGIAAFAMMLKNAEATARWNIQSDDDLTNFQRIHDKFVKKHGIDKVNEMISEWRDVKFLNNQKGIIDSKKMFYLTKPYSQEYENTYKEYSLKMKMYRNEVSKLYAAYQETVNKIVSPEQKAAHKLYLDKVAERDAYNVEYINWLVENASLPYVEEFYNLQSQLPKDTRDKLQACYLEQEVIRSSVGRGEEMNLEEADFHRLNELDIEIKKIRRDAVESNPEYAKYIEKFNELFEYDTNERYFKASEENAKIRYADDPATLKKWYEEHQVTRANQKWYEDLETLYEQRNEFYTDKDEDLADLFEKRNRIIRPYKENGRIKPRYFSEEDIQELNEVEIEIEDYLTQKSLEKKGKNELSKEEIGQLKEINRKIKSLSTESLSPLYIKQFDNETNVLYAAMNAYKLIESDLKNAEQNGDKKLVEELKKDYEAAVIHFNDIEKDYKKYYEKNHVNRYTSVTTNYDVRGNRNIRSFNYERLPSSTVRDIYMETVPNPRYYKLKKIKDAAINPNFIKGPDSIPLPKAVEINGEGHFKIKPGFEGSVNVNAKYNSIMKDPELAEYYESISKMFFNKQRQIEGRKIGWQIPGFESTSIEDISREGFTKAFGRSWERFKDSNLKLSKSEDDIVNNVFGDAGSRIRMRFTEQFSEDLQSKDAAGSIMKYAIEAHNNIAMQEVAPKADAFIELLKLQRKELQQKILSGPVYTTENGKRVEVDMKSRMGELTNVIDMLEFERRKLVYGQLETDKQRALKKVMSKVFAYTSFIRIGFDITNQAKNYISGNVQAFIAASGYDSDHYLRSNWVFAKGKVYGLNDGFLANYFSDYGKNVDLHESTMLYRLYNPMQKDMMKYYADSSGGKTRRITKKVTSIGEMANLFQDKGDTEIGVTVMYAVMDHYKYTELEADATGNMVPKLNAEGNEVKIPAHKCYHVGKNGELVRRKDVNFTVEDENRLRNIIYSEMKKAQGNYAHSDMTKAQETVVGKMAFFFRKFLVPGILNRFGYLRPNYEGSEMALGYWRSLWDCYKYLGAAATIKEFVVGTNLLKKMNMTGATTMKIKDPATGQMVSKDVGDFYARKIAHARHDAVAMGILLVMSLLARAYVQQKDDDDEDLSMLEGNMFRLIWGVQAETASMIPFGTGSQEYVKNFTTAIPFVRELTQTLKFNEHMLKYGLAMTINGGDEPDPDYDGQFYQNIYKGAFFQRQSGAYEKGDPKIVKDLVDLTGIKNFRDFFNPNYRIDILKRNQ